MGTEIERKFLVRNDDWMNGVLEKFPVAQAYLCKDPERTVRVRLKGEGAFITVKGRPPADRPLDTPEYEYAIPPAEARELLALCLPGEISKTRHIVAHAGKTWEVDVFHGKNAGLIVAEIELGHADEDFARPGWLGAEVTDDPRYKNAALSDKPWSAWTDGRRPAPKP